MKFIYLLFSVILLIASIANLGTCLVSIKPSLALNYASEIEYVLESKENLEDQDFQEMIKSVHKPKETIRHIKDLSKLYYAINGTETKSLSLILLLTALIFFMAYKLNQKTSLLALTNHRGGP